MFSRYFMVVLKMISSLSEIMTQSFKIELSRDGCPSEMIVTLLFIFEFMPIRFPERTSFKQDSFD